ncbi:MAG: PaaI family thioesterase [Oleibacter sp.]|nr:PaaI family thioesterase [Thalassolituus sp.]
MNDNWTEQARRFVSVLPHCRLLDMSVELASATELHMRLPYSDALIGNPDNGVLAGGCLTTLMDTSCGTAVFVALECNEVCPTLDLRVDYMRSATPGKDIIAVARVIRITASVVFTRCDLYEDTTAAEADVAKLEDDSDKAPKLVATCTAAFMRIGQHLDRSKANAK